MAGEAGSGESPGKAPGIWGAGGYQQLETLGPVLIIRQHILPGWGTGVDGGGLSSFVENNP